MHDLAAKGHTMNFEPSNSLQLPDIPRFGICDNGLQSPLLSELIFFTCPINFCYDLGDLMYSKHPAPHPSIPVCID